MMASADRQDEASARKEEREESIAEEREGVPGIVEVQSNEGSTQADANIVLKRLIAGFWMENNEKTSRGTRVHKSENRKQTESDSPIDSSTAPQLNSEEPIENDTPVTVLEELLGDRLERTRGLQDRVKSLHETVFGTGETPDTSNSSGIKVSPDVEMENFSEFRGRRTQQEIVQEHMTSENASTATRSDDFFRVPNTWFDGEKMAKEILTALNEIETATKNILNLPGFKESREGSAVPSADITAAPCGERDARPKALCTLAPSQHDGREHAASDGRDAPPTVSDYYQQVLNLNTNSRELPESEDKTSFTDVPHEFGFKSDAPREPPEEQVGTLNGFNHTRESKGRAGVWKQDPLSSRMHSSQAAKDPPQSEINRVSAKANVATQRAEDPPENVVLTMNKPLSHHVMSQNPLMEHITSQQTFTPPHSGASKPPLPHSANLFDFDHVDLHGAKSFSSVSTLGTKYIDKGLSPRAVARREEYKKQLFAVKNAHASPSNIAVGQCLSPSAAQRHQQYKEALKGQMVNKGRHGSHFASPE